MVTTCIVLPSGWTANPPPTAPQHLPAGPLTPDPAQPGVRPSEGDNRGMGGTATSPHHSAPGKQRPGGALKSHSTHFHGACCVPVLPLAEAPPPVQGSTAGVSGSTLSWASLHLPPGAPMKSWREKAARLPFRQVSFSPMSAPLQPGERGEACLYQPRVARSPPA